MENSTMTTSQLIADSYVSYHSQVYLYILHKVNCQKEAEDLSQDVFLRLMEADASSGYSEVFHLYHFPQFGK